MIKKMGVGPDGQLTKLERLCDALNYLKYYHQPSLKEKIDDMEVHIQRWKQVLRKEKNIKQIDRMENLSENSNLSLDVITNVVDNKSMWDKFEETVDALKRGRKVSDNSLKAAMGVVMVSVVLKSYQRPGAVCNCTVEEYKGAKTIEGISIIKVKDHKTSSKYGTAKLTLDTVLMERLHLYFDYVRPHLAQPGSDITNLFIMPGSQKVTKITNLIRFLENRFDMTIPTCTMARKIGATNAALSLDDPSNTLICKQMSHQPAVSDK